MPVLPVGMRGCRLPVPVLPVGMRIRSYTFRDEPKDTKVKLKSTPSGSHGLCREMVARPVTPGTPGEEGNQGEPLTLPTKMLHVHRVDLQDKSKKRGRKDRTLSFAASGASLAEQVRRSQ